jgi:hypothetical protein
MKNTPNQWLSVMKEAGQKKADVVPEGWSTIAQIAEETKKSDSRTRLLIKEAIKLGTVEESKFSVLTGNKLYPTTHYRIVK